LKDDGIRLGHFRIRSISLENIRRPSITRQAVPMTHSDPLAWVAGRSTTPISDPAGQLLTGEIRNRKPVATIIGFLLVTFVPGKIFVGFT